MFTGLVEEVGLVESVENRGDILRLRISASLIVADLKVGDSVSVNGACLTAVSIETSQTDDAGTFDVELVPETLRRTGLGDVQERSGVNLERSVTPTTRMGGHFVQGHVDGRGRILARQEDGAGGSLLFTVGAAPELMRLVVPKGYVALDGISLTIVDTGADHFRVALIPHTLEHTIAGGWKVGDGVNIETDILGKYVARLFSGGDNNTTHTVREEIS